MPRRSMILSALTLLLAAPPVFGQAASWQKKWYWGAEAGTFFYSNPITGDAEMALSAGGHWMVTGKSSALYIAFDQLIFPDSTQSLISDPSAPGGQRLVDFSSGRRIQASIFAIPMDRNLQIMLGGGFSIQQINGAVAQGPFVTPQEQVNASNTVAELDTKAFLVAAVGAQYRVGRWAVFGNFNYLPAAREFLIPGDAFSIMAGIRYALTSSHDELSTDR